MSGCGLPAHVGLPQTKQDEKSGIFVKIQGPFPDIRSYSYVFLGRLKEHRTIIPENFSSTLSLTFTNLCDKGLILNHNSVVLYLIEKEEQGTVLPWLLFLPPPNPLPHLVFRVVLRSVWLG